MTFFIGVLINCFDMYILTIIASRLCEKRQKKKITKLLYIAIIGFLITAITTYALVKEVSILLILVTLIISLNILYKKVLGIVLTSAVWMALMVLCEIIGLNIVSSISDSHISNIILDDNSLTNLVVIFSRTLEYITAMFIFGRIREDSLSRSFRRYRLLFFLVTAVMISNMVILYYYVITSVFISNVFIIYFSTCIAIYFIFIFYMIYKLEAIAHENEKQALINLENQMTKEHSEKMEFIVDRFHQLNHDYRFHMQTLKELLDGHRYENAEDYFQEVSTSFEDSSKGLIDNHPVISVLLMKAANKAKENDIVFKCEVPKSLDLQISESDLNVILSNLLENAFQAVEKVIGEEKRINLEIVNRPDNIMIVLENPYENPIRKEGNFIRTSKKDTLNHGHGLKSVNHIVEKYEGFMNIEILERIFSSTIIIPK